MKIRVSPLEKPYVFEALDKAKIEYVKEELYLYTCESCDNIYRPKPEKCECGCEEFSSEEMADIVGWNYNYAVERKRGNNIISSVMNNEIYDQLRKFKEHFNGNVALIFEGDFQEEIKKEVEAMRKRGSLSRGNMAWTNQIYSIPAVCCQYGVSFIQTKDIDETIKFLRFFDNHCGQEPKFRLKKEQMFKNISPFVKKLMTTKGIGIDLANKIYEYYKKPFPMMMSLMDDRFPPIKGIGKIKLQNIKDDWL